MLKDKDSDRKYEMEYLGTAVYRWHVVAEQLRAFDRKWHKNEYKGSSRFAQKEIDQFQKSYEKLVSWGYDLQEKALNSLVNPVADNNSTVTQEHLIQAIKEAVAPRLRDHDNKIHEHDVVIEEIQSAVPVLRDQNEFITIKQAIAEQGLDPTSMPNYPNSKENLSGMAGQLLKERRAPQGDPITSRIDGQKFATEVNTYHRGDIYKVLKEISNFKQARLL